MHATILGLVMIKQESGKAINEQGFFVKFLFVLGSTFGLLNVSNKVLQVYIPFAEFTSLAFLVYQSIALIDFGYSWNEAWTDRYSKGQVTYGMLLICAAFLLFGINLAILFINFYNFWLPECTYNKINLVLNSIFVVGIFTFELVKKGDSKSVLACLFVGTLLSYNNGLSLDSYWTDTCNPFVTVSDHRGFVNDSIFHVIINLIFAFVAITYASFSGNTSTSFQNTGLQYKEAEVEDQSELERSLNSVIDERNIKEYLTREYRPSFVSYNSNYYSTFHLIMIAFSVYLVMVFFDWKSADYEKGQLAKLRPDNVAAFFLKTFNSVCIVCVYLVTLAAAIIAAPNALNP
jgi:hypothetical protein